MRRFRGLIFIIVVVATVAVLKHFGIIPPNFWLF